MVSKRNGDVPFEAPDDDGFKELMGRCVREAVDIVRSPLANLDHLSNEGERCSSYAMRGGRQIYRETRSGKNVDTRQVSSRAMKESGVIVNFHTRDRQGKCQRVRLENLRRHELQ